MRRNARPRRTRTPNSVVAGSTRQRYATWSGPCRGQARGVGCASYAGNRRITAPVPPLGGSAGDAAGCRHPTAGTRPVPAGPAGPFPGETLRCDFAYLQTGLPKSTCEGFVAAPTVAPAAAPSTSPTDGAPSNAPPTKPATAPIPAPLAARSPCVAPQADSRN